MKEFDKLFAILVLLTLLMSSCAPTLTELWMNKDDSGKMVSTMDMEEMEDFRSMLFGEEEGDSNEVMDSLIYISSMVPKELQSSMKYPELWDKMSIRLKTQDGGQGGVIQMAVDFESNEELVNMFQDMEDVLGANDEINPILTMGDGKSIRSIFLDYEVDDKNGIIRLQQKNFIESMIDVYGERMISDLDSLQYRPEDGPDYDMMKMFLGGEKQTIVHAPGPILFTSEIDALIEGNKVTFTINPFEDLRKGKKLKFKERIVKYKN